MQGRVSDLSKGTSGLTQPEVFDLNPRYDESQPFSKIPSLAAHQPIDQLLMPPIRHSPKYQRAATSRSMTYQNGTLMEARPVKHLVTTPMYISALLPSSLIHSVVLQTFWLSPSAGILMEPLTNTTTVTSAQSLWRPTRSTSHGSV